MADDAFEELSRQLAALRNQHLRMLAEVDPTLTRLKATLEEERRWHIMPLAELVRAVEQLEAKYGTPGGPPHGAP